jgi:hypothetical protein
MSFFVARVGHRFSSLAGLRFRPFRALEFGWRPFQGLKPLAKEFSPLRGCGFDRITAFAPERCRSMGVVG